MPKKKILIIDGSSLMYRAFFALPLLTTAAGQYTNAVYGFTSMLAKLLAELQPDKAVVAFDKGKITFRHEWYAEYKGKRQATPSELSPQFPLMQKVLETLGISVLELAGYEADDIIGTLAAKAEAAGEEALIVTGDRDALQLVSDSVKVLMTKRGITDLEWFDNQAVFEKYSLTPRQVIDLKGLMGDASDNIPGVPGIGEKTAVKLLKEFETVENLLNHIPDVSGAKLKERLAEHADLARLSKRLATIDCQVPLSEADLACEIKPDYERLQTLFDELEFKTLFKRFVSNNELPEDQAVCSNAIACTYEKVNSEQVCTHLERLIRQAEKLVFFPLWQGKGPDLSLEAVAVATADALYLVEKTHCTFLFKLWSDSQITKITSEAKYLYQYGKLYQFSLRNIAFDAALAAYLVDPAAASYDMATLSQKYLGEAFLPAEEELAKTVRSAAALAKLHPLLQTKLADASLLSLYESIELPLLKVLADLEVTGIFVDEVNLNALSATIDAKVTLLLAAIYEAAGEKFNVNSTKQLGLILFEKLQLPVIKKTKTGYSTDAEVLETLAAEYPHPLISNLLEYRTLMKLKSTYLDGLKPLIHPTTGRIHTSFNQLVTTTGRLSSSDPNLQNIPVRTEEGRKIRSLFVPQKPWDYLLSADYSQIELRVLAHMSGDAHLISAFEEKQDIHAQTAAKVFGVAESEVTSEMRSRAKAVNFGIVYGISEYGLARDIHVTRKEAASYIDSYFSLYGGVKELMDRLIAEAHETGFVTTLFGRRRYLPDINSRNFNLRSFAERTAMNTPIQGTAADIIKKAMIAVYERLQDAGLESRMLLQVHDELVLEVRESEVLAVSELVKTTMEQVVSLKVPLEVDVKFGKNWALAK